MNNAHENLESIVLGGGCFWCLEAVFLRVNGVQKVVSGYAGGETREPTYERVCTGKTGHAETVQITYDPKVISLEDILLIFFSVHDPTTLNRQGSDVGTQYRSIVLFANQNQHDAAEKILRKLAEENMYDGEMIVTELKKLDTFYPAEDYHQRYFEKNPEKAYCQIIISPKIAKLREKFAKFYHG